ncbi:aminotransferase class V-fold PLP-dependent enzyme, partial [Candidatus Pacearchaeota archaeon]|nr:aminotransferase class V-fold PLP-dependent enzyme [Candidatus Pacearchaeota archaeon]
YGNPGSFHSKGLEAKNALDNARQEIASLLNCSTKEIIFTSGGTESINLAIKGIALANKEKNHIITSKIEHPAVLNSCAYLEEIGFKVSYLDVDKYGKVNPKDVENSINERTSLVSIMYANNEIGTIEPIKEIAEICKKKGVLFHTDACQAAGCLNLDIKYLGVDLLTINGSKIYGPKGIGMLYLREGIEIVPLVHGGGQESRLRSGTENVPYIVGFAKALEIAQKNKDKENARLSELRDYLIAKLLKIPKSRLNGHSTERLPNNVNISFMDVEGEAMLLYLNEMNIYASTGSACASKSLEPSHVLRAIGLSYEGAHGSIRFTLGKDSVKEYLDRVADAMPGIVKKLKKISPVNLSMEHFT